MQHVGYFVARRSTLPHRFHVRLINFQSNQVEICSLLVFMSYILFTKRNGSQWEVLWNLFRFFMGDMRKLAIYWDLDKKADEKLAKMFDWISLLDLGQLGCKPVKINHEFPTDLILFWQLAINFQSLTVLTSLLTSNS
jgi:hypothetical protein